MISVRPKVTPRLRRGIYILPSLFTVASLFCGFYSIICATGGRFQRAAVLILVAAVLDVVDGQVARLTRTNTDFGLQFDSLADMASFGIAPAILVHVWALSELRRLGWLMAFIYVACGAARLARFNLGRHADWRYFVGLPIPAAALTIAAIVNYHPEVVVEPLAMGAVATLVVFIALLMISRLRYRSLKEADQIVRKPHLAIIVVALIYSAIAYDPQVIPALLALAYVVSGLLPKGLGRLRGRMMGTTLGAQDAGEEPWKERR
ncbi:MAG: CDP-diacylglycerol--serine O-phosphatidyltransferase [Acidobacteriota bacterium]